MTLPNYLVNPKPGVRDSIRKWERIRKEALREKKGEIGDFYNKVAGHGCGLCEKYHCDSCPFPIMNKYGRRCGAILDEGERAVDIKDPHCRRKALVKACDRMLRILRKIEEDE